MTLEELGEKLDACLKIGQECYQELQAQNLRTQKLETRVTKLEARSVLDSDAE